MTLVMAYVILIAAVIAAGAVLLEAVRGRGAAARWVWVVAMAFTMAATLFAMIAPRRIAVEMAEASATETSNMLMLRPTDLLTSSLPDAQAAAMVLDASDSVLPVAWLVATLVLLGALVIGQGRFRLERRKAREAKVGGHDVLLTEDLGPAVAGVRRPVVFVPRWVLALDNTSQQLLLAHEIEHVKRRDTSLLLFGAVTAAITPWNPAVWWMVRRLRLAVEQDCDARVLAIHPGVRRYADLLLTAASRHGLTTRLLAAHFGEHSSDLLRRIEAMTNRTIPWRRIAGSTFIAAALFAAACETPRPDPVAPLPINAPASIEQEVPVNSVRSVEFSELRSRCTPNGGSGCQFSVIVQSSDGKELARYVDEIPAGYLPVAGVYKINVENGECGKSSCSLIWVTLKPGVSLSKTPPRDKSFTAAEGQFTELRVDSSLERELKSRNALTRSEALNFVEIPLQPDSRFVSARFMERDGERVQNGKGFVTWPPRNAKEKMPNVIIQAANGSEVARFIADNERTLATSPMAEIRKDDISSIEVMKGQTGCEPLGCPLVRVWLKPGREGAYRKR